MMPIIPFHDFGGHGPPLHFAHANGYPPHCYRQLLEPLLPHYQVKALNQRPLWPGSQPAELTSWAQLADDLITFLDEQGLQNVVGVGHSLGAVGTMFAALARPDLFSALVLIEPVFLPPALLAAWGQATAEERRNFPLSQTALNRRDLWASREEAFAHYRPKPVFSRFSNESLWDYVNYGLVENGLGQITLAFTKEWEAHIYGLIPQVWEPLTRLSHPTLGIRATESNTLFPEAWEKWQTIQPPARFVEFAEASHLLPFEDPTAVAQTILDFLPDRPYKQN